MSSSSDPTTQPDRRRPEVPTLHQPVEPARLRATIAGRQVLEEAEVIALTDRTLVVEVRDAMLALALSVAHDVEVTLEFGGGCTTLVAEPGRRSSDNPTSRRVELVLRGRR